MYDLLPGIASSTKFSAVGMPKNQGWGHLCVQMDFSNVRLFKGEGFASIPNKFCGKVGPLTHPGGSNGPAV